MPTQFVALSAELRSWFSRLSPRQQLQAALLCVGRDTALFLAAALVCSLAVPADLLRDLDYRATALLALAGMDDVELQREQRRVALSIGFQALPSLLAVVLLGRALALVLTQPLDVAASRQHLVGDVGHKSSSSSSSASASTTVHPLLRLRWDGLPARLLLELLQPLLAMLVFVSLVGICLSAGDPQRAVLTRLCATLRWFVLLPL